MKAIILAGGFGTRLKDVVPDVPKPMAPVRGAPFLKLLIDRLVLSGVNELILSTGYLHETIYEYFGNGSEYNASIDYCVEQEPLGTGGAVLKALGMVGNEDVLIVNGDTYAGVSIDKLITFHNQQKTVITMAVIPMKDASRYGCVQLSHDGKVVSFLEKSTVKNGLINSGVYIANSGLQGMFPQGKLSLELDVLPALAHKGLLAALVQHVPFIDIGMPEDYLEFCRNTSNYTSKLD